MAMAHSEGGRRGSTIVMSQQQQRFVAMQAQGAGRGTALCNLCNIALGSGVLGFPAAYSSGGWLYTSIFIVLFACLGALSNCIMIRSCSNYQAVCFSSVVHAALGPVAGRLTALTMVVYSFGGCAAFMVMVGDFLVPVCLHAATASGWGQGPELPPPRLCERRLLIFAVAVVVMLPLSLRKTVTALDVPSRLAIFGILFLIGAVLWSAVSAVWLAEGGRVGQGVVAVSSSASKLIQPTGTVAWSFAVMLGIPNVFAELKAGASGSGGRGGSGGGYMQLSRRSNSCDLSGVEMRAQVDRDAFDQVSPDHDAAADLEGVDHDDLGSGSCEGEGERVRAMDVVIAVQALVTASTYIIVGGAAYIQFGEAAGGDGAANVMNLYSSSVLIDSVRLALSLVAAVSFPIIHFTARMMLYDLCVEVKDLIARLVFCGEQDKESPDSEEARAWNDLAVNDAEREPLRSAPGGHGGGDDEYAMPRVVRWALTLVFWGSCTAFALAGYELGVIFALFGSTCSVLVTMIIPALLLLDDGPWHAEAAYGGPCGCGSSVGARRVLGGGMLGSGGVVCLISVWVLTKDE